MRRILLFLMLTLGVGLTGLAGVMTMTGATSAAMPERSRETAAPAPPPPPVDLVAIERIWRDWMARHGIETSAMAVGAAGEVIHSAGAGRDPAAPRPVASLSKAITALCVNDILQGAGLTWSTTMGDIAEALGTARVTPPYHVRAITLGQLVTHSGGLSPDITQGDMVSRLHGSLGLHRRIAWQAMQKDAVRGEPGTYFYSNTNYALLGTVAEALTGDTYAAACMDRIAAPAGATGAVIEGRMGSMSSYAGWEISAEDFTRLAMHWFGADRPWVADPAAYPLVKGYGLGVDVTGKGADAVMTHAGRLCSREDPDNNIGALFVATGEGIAFAANWDGCMQPGVYTDLSQAISRALR